MFGSRMVVGGLPQTGAQRTRTVHIDENAPKWCMHHRGARLALCRQPK
jgi:hypothetical protein